MNNSAVNSKSHIQIYQEYIQIPAIEEIHTFLITKLCKYNIFSVEGDRAIRILNNRTLSVCEE